MVAAELRQRLVSGSVLTIVGLLALIAGGWFFAILCGTVAGLINFELARLLNGRHLLFWPPLAGVGTLAGFTATYAVAVTLDLTGNLIFPLIFLVTVATAIFVPKDRLLYVAFGGAALIASYNMATARIINGVWLCGWVLMVVAATDIAGFFFGKVLGGPRLAPRISPGKRWSGTIAGWVAAFSVSMLFSNHLGDWIMWAGLALSAFSQLGDLAESWLKRRAGVKNSSSLIPGHGGVLDRFDGMIGANLGLCILDQASIVPVSMFSW